MRRMPAEADYAAEDEGTADLMAANRETAAETGLPYMTEALDEAAKAVLKA